MYLCIIIDWYSRKIVGWALSDSFEAAPVTECMQRTIDKYGTPGIANSDQGSIYSANSYIKLLKSHSIRQSMDGRGRFTDNIICKRWFKTLKSEHLRIIEYTTPRELRKEIYEFIKKYNEIRLHESLDYVTPNECYEVVFQAAT